MSDKNKKVIIGLVLVIIFGLALFFVSNREEVEDVTTITLSSGDVIDGEDYDEVIVGTDASGGEVFINNSTIDSLIVNGGSVVNLDSTIVRSLDVENDLEDTMVMLTGTSRINSFRASTNVIVNVESLNNIIARFSSEDEELFAQFEGGSPRIIETGEETVLILKDQETQNMATTRMLERNNMMAITVLGLDDEVYKTIYVKLGYPLNEEYVSIEGVSSFSKDGEAYDFNEIITEPFTLRPNL